MIGIMEKKMSLQVGLSRAAESMYTVDTKNPA